MIMIAATSVAAEGHLVSNPKGHDILEVTVETVITEGNIEEKVLQECKGKKISIQITCKCGKPVSKTEKATICNNCTRAFHKTCLDEDRCGACSMHTVGLQWSGGDFQNTCPIDGHLTVVAEYASSIPDFLRLFRYGGKNMAEFANAVTAAVNGDPIRAQNMWAKVAMDYDKKAKNRTDVYGNMEERIHDVMPDCNRFYRMEVCNKWSADNTGACKAGPTRHPENFHTLSNSNLTASEDFTAMMTETAPKQCRKCPRKERLLGTSIRSFGPLLVDNHVAPPPFFEINNGVHHRKEEIIEDLPDEIMIDHHRYIKKIVTIHNTNHYTSLFKKGGDWFEYDGMRGARMRRGDIYKCANLPKIWKTKIYFWKQPNLVRQINFFTNGFTP
jgi:hypothetical protein